MCVRGRVNRVLGGKGGVRGHENDVILCVRELFLSLPRKCPLDERTNNSLVNFFKRDSKVSSAVNLALVLSLLNLPVASWRGGLLNADLMMS